MPGSSDDVVGGEKGLDNTSAAGRRNGNQAAIGSSRPAVALGESLPGHENVPGLVSILKSPRHSGSEDHVGAAVQRPCHDRIETTGATADESETDARPRQWHVEEESAGVPDGLEPASGAPRCAFGIEREEDGDLHAAYGVTASTRMPS